MSLERPWVALRDSKEGKEEEKGQNWQSERDFIHCTFYCVKICLFVFFFSNWKSYNEQIHSACEEVTGKDVEYVILHSIPYPSPGYVVLDIGECFSLPVH